MTNKKKALILGGTSAHSLLIEKLKKRGYFTILVDYYENPIAKQVADKHIQETTLDKEKVLEIAKKENLELVITTCIDQANVTACYVAEELGLPAPYSYETALEVTNKILMKKKMIDNGIPTSRFYHIKNIEDYNKYKLDFPIIVKPADSNSSKGVRKANNNKELYNYLAKALDISRVNEAIIEEYKEGQEIGIDCFIENQEVNILTTRYRRKINDYNTPTQQIYGTISPADVTQKTFNKLKDIANKIARVFNLDNTPIMLQTIVEDDEINVIEFAPRIGGGESSRMIKLRTDFDILNAAIDSFLNIKVEVNQKENPNYFSDNLIYANKATFGEIKNVDHLIDSSILEYIVPYKRRGMEIGSNLTSNNRVGAFVVKSQNKKELFEKIDTVINKLDVYDINGESIMKRDIY